MIKLLQNKEQDEYNRFITHPLQSWEWGEFRRSTGVQVFRFGQFRDSKLFSAFQLTLHKLPYLPLYVGYVPKGPLPDEETINYLTQFGKEKKCIFTKFEPNVESNFNPPVGGSNFKLLIPSIRPLFTKYTFYINLTKSEEELMKSFSQKTRYNIRVAQKHGVTIQEENTAEAFNRYLQLTYETTKRQKFYAHDKSYHQKMWQFLNRQQITDNSPPIAHLLTARYKEKILVTWILFLFNNTLYYPYGASSTENKEVMASNLMMWEAICWGKNHGATNFDLWGTPGDNPAPSDPYFGFHRFKMGYGPRLVEFVGSFDLVINPFLYRLFELVNSFRWWILKY